MVHSQTLHRSVIPVSDPSQVGQARRTAGHFGELSGLSEEQGGEVAIVATELASNLIRHSGGGQIIVQQYGNGTVAGVELLSIDKGPGMSDVPRCLEDGVSAKGGLGGGLGAVCRLSTEFDLYSLPGQGTVVLSRISNE